MIDCFSSLPHLPAWSVSVGIFTRLSKCSPACLGELVVSNLLELFSWLRNYALCLLWSYSFQFRGVVVRNLIHHLDGTDWLHALSSLIVIWSVCSTKHAVDGIVPLQWFSSSQSLLWYLILLTSPYCVCYTGPYLSTVLMQQTIYVFHLGLNRDNSPVCICIVHCRINSNAW